MKDMDELFDLLRERAVPFAMYRLPGESSVHLMVQYSSLPLPVDKLDDLPELPGFLIAPFPVNGGDKAYLLQPDLVCAPEEAPAKLGDVLHRHNPTALLSPGKSTDTTHEEYVKQVQLAVEAIRAEEFNKVIISRNKAVDRPHEFRPERFFAELCAEYEHAFVYYWQLPGVGSWLGATPEVLMREQQGRISTLSLAGTQLYFKPDLEEYCWKAKEIAEQAFVSRFIVQLLDKMGVEAMEIDGPRNFRAGNLVHLATGFQFESDNLRVSRGRFIARLHPTPAVAGLPRDESLEFIKKTEQYNRSYFSGLVGPVQLKGETHLYVNLRCMQLFADQLVLYSGAGITAHSDPEKEWMETENKMKTLLNVMHVQTGH